MYILKFLFFFFQAEDGIRDHCVTGVQTCALPIFTITGCMDNCTPSESQDIALVPAKKAGRLGFNVLVGGKMGSGGFTVASPLNVFVEIFQAAAVVVELVKIYRDHGPREARSKCRFAFLIEEWGVRRLRAEL